MASGGAAPTPPALRALLSAHPQEDALGQRKMSLAERQAGSKGHSPGFKEEKRSNSLLAHHSQLPFSDFHQESRILNISQGKVASALCPLGEQHRHV